MGLDGGRIVGCVAIRKLDDGVRNETSFVRPEAIGTGLGRRLAQAIMMIAQELGYSLMRLDTLDKLSEALSLEDVLHQRFLLQQNFISNTHLPYSSTEVVK